MTSSGSIYPAEGRRRVSKRGREARMRKNGSTQKKTLDWQEEEVSEPERAREVYIWEKGRGGKRERERERESCRE